MEAHCILFMANNDRKMLQNYQLLKIIVIVFGCFSVLSPCSESQEVIHFCVCVYEIQHVSDHSIVKCIFQPIHFP